MTPQAVLNFWFKEASGKWWGKDEAFDSLIRERFSDTYEKAVRGELKHWRETPEGRLAEIIVLDQFSRNLFRDSLHAFAHDDLALTLAREAVRTGDDKRLSPEKRHFLYMPYMHSESPQAHREAMRLYFSLLPWRWGALYYEWKHKRIIDRFGRYPHRNNVLGRESTPEEIEFLKSHQGF
jgi:uncharacterized protein (DUF924 family)